MEIQSFNQELQVANLQFQRLFNNISIVSNGKCVKFKCVNGLRSRIFKNLENPERNSMYSLPLIIIERTGISKNSDRISNINNEIKYQVRRGTLAYDLFTPIPIDISYRVTIISKYQDHVDRCISNFIPFFNKDLYVRSEHPKFQGVNYSNQVVMDDGIDFDKPDELDGSTDDLVTCTCNFTFKTYMFCGNEKAEKGSVKRIVKTVLSSYVEYDEEGNPHEVSAVISAITDTAYIGFIPQINTIGVGYYPIPLLSTYDAQFEFVGQRYSPILSDAVELQDPWVDRFRWVIDETGSFSQLNGRIYQKGPGEYVNYWDNEGR